MKIDHIYVINLRSEVQDIVDRLNGLNLPKPTDYTIVGAINGRNLISNTNNESVPYEWKASDWWKIDGHSNNWWARDVNAVEVGCTLSHYKCWLDAKKNAYQSVLILEEDFICKENVWPEDLNLLPDDWEFMYMGRMKNSATVDIPYNKSIVKPGYAYNAHAYLISGTGIEKAINTNPNLDIIPADELIVGFMGNHPREDVNKRFNVNLNMFAFSEGDPYYITQTAIMKKSIDSNFEILQANDWNAWCQKYITPVMLQHDYELMTDELGPNIVEFPLFTNRFCEELIQLAETNGEWTVGRHEFYPTNDMLMEHLGIKDIYTRVIREFVAPLATWYFTLEGEGWDTVVDETFIIRYKPDLQGQLSVHHDYSSYTIGVKLNDEFEGGGTFFPKYGVNALPKRIGSAFLHPGMITHRHGGRPVYSGTRYINVSFIKNTSILK